MKNEKIGILGGTFDPIHYGHLQIAQFCKEKLSLDKILFIPAGSPPHKQPVEKYVHRVEMVKLAIDDKRSYILAELEKPEQNQPDKPNYTYETLQKVNKLHADAKIYFIVGEDNVPEIQNWYKYKNLFGLAKFIVLSRKSKRNAKLKNLSYYDKLNFIDMSKIDISSAEIRNKLKENEQIRELVPLKIWNYIKIHKLYKKFTKEEAK